MNKLPIYICAVLVMFAAPLFAADSDLDTTFGTEGKVAIDFPTWDSASAVALQVDGKIVVAGATGAYPGVDFTVVRYNVTGSLDATFGSGGRVVTDFSGFRDWASAVAIQSDGKIIVAGLASRSPSSFPSFADSDFALVRYNQDGSPDITFGTEGKVITNFSDSLDDTSSGALAMAIQWDGKIVVAGFASKTLRYRNTGLYEDFALARYNGDGSADSTFGVEGRVITDFTGLADGSRAVAIQSDGRIIAAGFASRAPGYPDFALARYNSDGSLDGTFGAGGKVTAPFRFVDYFWAVGSALAIQPDGKIVVAGETAVGWTGLVFAVARYNFNGSPDATFGNGGQVTSMILSEDAGAAALAIQSDGKIVAGGRAFVGYFNGYRHWDYAFAVVRYNPDGSPDATYGVAGALTTDFSHPSGPADWQWESIAALAIQTDGKLVAVGSTTNSPDSTIALARYNLGGEELSRAAP